MAHRSGRSRRRRYWIYRLLLIVGMFLGGFILVVLVSPQARKVVMMMVRGEKAVAPGELVEEEKTGPLTVQDILAKYFKATGGYEKQINLTSIKVIGKVKRVNDSLELAIFKKAPNLVRTSTTFANGKLVMAYDGKEVWKQLTTANGQTLPAETVPPEIAWEFVRDASINSILFNYESVGARIELMGEELFNSHTCYKLRVTYPDGMLTDYFIDSTQFYERGSRIERQIDGHNSVQESRSDDYKSFDELIIPMETQIYSDGEWQRTFLVQDIQINGGILKDLFIRPATTADPKESQPGTVE